MTKHFTFIKTPAGRWLFVIQRTERIAEMVFWEYMNIATINLMFPSVQKKYKQAWKKVIDTHYKSFV